MSGLVVFSPQVRRLANFYAAVLGAQQTLEESGDIRLTNDLDEVLIHTVPKSVADRIVLSVPPSPRKSSSLKPIFDVTSLELALGAVRAHGGVVTDNTFSFAGMTRHDVLDPDGNIIQLRSKN